MELPKQQQAIYDFIKEFIEDKGYSPTYREIQDHLCFESISSVTFHLKKLREKALISYENNSPRTIRLANYKVTLVPVP